MARTFDIYRPPVLPDPSLRILERRGIWAFGGIAVLAAILVVGGLLRLDQLGHDPLGPTEACVWRDWQKSALGIAELERREVLTPVYHGTLRLWARVGPSQWMLRLHSVLWALLLVALVFRLGAIYFNARVGALAALLLAVSPLFVATSQDIGPVAQASVLLTIHYACLLRAIYRESSERRWGLYLLTGALAVACHPLSVWVILAQAALAFAAGPREERYGFYGRLATHAVLIVLFAWVWFRVTSPADPSWQGDWGAPTDQGWRALVRLLGATAFWGTRLYPSGWLWILASLVLVAVPLVYGGLIIRHRQTQELNGLLLTSAVAPPALILLMPRWIIDSRCPPGEILTLTVAPLVLWAASSAWLGLRGRVQRVLLAVLVGGGAVVTLWSSRVEVAPAWEIYHQRLEGQLQRGRAVVLSRVARLADFEQYLGSRLDLKDIEQALAVAPKAEKNLVVFEARSRPYRASDPADSPAPLIRVWLEKNCRRIDLLRDDRHFRLLLWDNFDSTALSKAVNRQTFYGDRTEWERLRFVRWFGPFEPGFDRLGATSRAVRVPSAGAASRLRPIEGELGRALVRSRAQWLFQPQQPPGYYHVFVPLRLVGQNGRREQVVDWTLPDGRRKRQVVTDETEGFSFIWETLTANEPLKVAVFAPGCDWRSDRIDLKGSQPPLVFLGVGLRRHFPYVVDVGAPFDDMALGAGWHESERKDDVTYRWTRGRARLTFYLPAAGGIGLEGQLSLRVAYRDPKGPSRMEFEVFWDDEKLDGKHVATEEWTHVRLELPSIPAPGRHEVTISSSFFRRPTPSGPRPHERFGLMVDSVAIE